MGLIGSCKGYIRFHRVYIRFKVKLPPEVCRGSLFRPLAFNPYMAMVLKKTSSPGMYFVLSAPQLRLRYCREIFQGDRVSPLLRFPGLQVWTGSRNPKGSTRLLEPFETRADTLGVRFI